MDNNLPTECCAKCRFANEYAEATDKDIAVFSCRRFPPVFTAQFPFNVALLDVYRQALECCNWPFVTAEGWCGEFERVPEVATPASPVEQPRAKYPLLHEIPFHVRAMKALRHLVPEKTGVPWEECTIDMLSLFSFDDLRSHRGCGGTTIDEIREECLKYDLFLRGEDPPLPDEKRTLRHLGATLSVAALHMLERYFKDIGTPNLIGSCSMNDLMRVPPGRLNPAGIRSDRIANEFRSWRRKYRHKALAIPEQD